MKAVAQEEKKREEEPTTTPHITQAQHPLGAIEKLTHHLYPKPLLKPFPHVRPQPVPEHEFDGVLPVQGRRGRREQVPRRLADIDKGRGARGPDVGPEGRDAEFAPDADAHT